MRAKFYPLYIIRSNGISLSQWIWPNFEAMEQFLTYHIQNKENKFVKGDVY